jgi:excisionase family DNA binding protein
MLLDVRELSQRLGVSQRAIWAWVERGELPAPIELGRLRRWRLQDIERWLAEKASQVTNTNVN